MAANGLFVLPTRAASGFSRIPRARWVKAITACGTRIYGKGFFYVDLHQICTQFGSYFVVFVLFFLYIFFLNKKKYVCVEKPAFLSRNENVVYFTLQFDYLLWHAPGKMVKIIDILVRLLSVQTIHNKVSEMKIDFSSTYIMFLIHIRFCFHRKQ